MRRKKSRLDSDGLHYWGIEEPSDQQLFLGLSFGQQRGRISFNHERLWKLRLILPDAAAQEFSCGGEMLQLIAHFNGAALLRRPLLSIFSAGYQEAEFGNWQLRSRL